MIDVTLKGVDRAVKDLRQFRAAALPHAMRNGLNDVVFAGRKVWLSEIEKSFVLRNKFTTRRVMVVKARGVKDLEARLGHTEDYMRTQEFGGVEHGGVPTTVASGEGRGAQPRRKVVRRPMRHNAIKLGGARRGGSRKQRNIVAIRQAQSQGRKWVFLELQRARGIFRLSGGKRKPRLDLVWSHKRGSHRIKPEPTLHRTLKILEPQIPRMHLKALVDQCRRHRIFGY